MRGRAVTLHGSGLNTRNFLFVTDVARAFETILFKGEIGQIYNIGGTNEVSNIEVRLIALSHTDFEYMIPQVARSLIRIMGHHERIETLVTYVPDRAFNDLRYTINSAKLIELGWTEQVSFEEGLRQTVEWYKNNSSRFGDIEGALVAHPRAGLGSGAFL